MKQQKNAISVLKSLMTLRIERLDIIAITQVYIKEQPTIIATWNIKYQPHSHGVSQPKWLWLSSFY